MATLKRRVQRTRARLQALPDPATPGPSLNLIQGLDAGGSATGTATQEAKLFDNTPVSAIPRADFKYGYLLDEVHEMGFAAAVCLASYSTSADDIELTRSTIGADSIERITGLGSDVPDGLKIVYPDTDLYVIQGTTTGKQVGIYQQSEGAVPHYLLGTGVAPVANSIPDPTAMGYFGTWYAPFVQLGWPWVKRIGADIEASKGARKVALFGHSLGAAVCNLVSNWAGFMYLSEARLGLALGLKASHGDVYGGAVHSYWNAVDYGYCLGSPRVMWWGYDSYKLASGDSSPTATSKLGFPFDAITRRVNLYNIGADPIPLVPSPFLGAPWYFYGANATVGKNVLGTQFSRVRSLPYEDRHNSLSPNERDHRGTIPRTVEEFKFRLANFHRISAYMAKAKSCHIGMFGGGSANLNAMDYATPGENNSAFS